ncbi:Serine--tRNA ligase, mitochondrial [Polyrhizophydium stewartii]|uniref:serine--tRNA ligase n=1 Tax=Polyrhizophydium stewartii TaxID=2732419 RepID=A0ABR4NCG8_9FUNG
MRLQRLFQPHLNYRRLRSGIEELERNVRDRRIRDLDVHAVATLHQQVAQSEFAVADLRKQRNRIAADMSQVVKDLAAAKSRKESSPSNVKDLEARRRDLAEQGKALKAALQAKENDLAGLQARLFDEARHLPNDTHPSVPVGDESKAVTIATIGSARVATADSPLRSHLELAALHDMLDIERAGKVSGSRFYYLKNAGALLEQALVRYASDICIRRGFTPVAVPDLIRHEVLEACGFSPRSDDPQTYYVSSALVTSSEAGGTSGAPRRDPMSLCLAATAEFPLAGMYAGETLSELPVRMVGVGRAFRAEGLAGAVNRGLYRVHQFTKVEMFALARPSESMDIFDAFVGIQREIFEGLELCFRILNMPTEELGAPAFIKYDMEAWMPARNAWGEISSTSNCTDYQARRLNIRSFVQHRQQDSGLEAASATSSAEGSSTTEFVHTVNGTACAIPRVLIALLETHQHTDGSIGIPAKLRPYLFGPGVSMLPVGAKLTDLLQ